MQAQSPRLTPLDPREFTAEQKQVVGAWDVLNFSRVMARHPALYRVFVPYIEKVIRFTELPPRDREVLVIRVLALCNETYEADHHVDIARKVGMTDAEIDAIKACSDQLSVADRELIDAADELVREHCLSDASWQALAQRYSTVQLMEVVGLVGCYTTMAMLTRSFGIEPEPKTDAEQRLAELRDYT